MKIFKLGLTFIIILGAAVGGFFIIDGNGGWDPTPIDHDLYEEYRGLFVQHWSDKGDWDKDLFLSHCDLIAQLSCDFNTDPLKDMNTSIAVEIINEKVFAEWKSPTCSKNVVNNYVDAIKTIERKDSNADKNILVKEIKDVNYVYRRAYNLAGKKIFLMPTYDGSAWNSFSDYSNDINRDREKVLKDEKYKTYLSNIVDLKKGLESIPDKISKARVVFYDSLAVKIAGFYNAIPDTTRTNDQLKALRNSRNNYQDEYGESNVINECARQFNIDVQNNENRARKNDER